MPSILSHTLLSTLAAFGGYNAVSQYTATKTAAEPATDPFAAFFATEYHSDSSDTTTDVDDLSTISRESSPGPEDAEGKYAAVVQEDDAAVVALMRVFGSLNLGEVTSQLRELASSARTGSVDPSKVAALSALPRLSLFEVARQVIDVDDLSALFAALEWHDTSAVNAGTGRHGADEVLPGQDGAVLLTAPAVKAAVDYGHGMPATEADSESVTFATDAMPHRFRPVVSIVQGTTHGVLWHTKRVVKGLPKRATGTVGAHLPAVVADLTTPTHRVAWSPPAPFKELDTLEYAIAHAPPPLPPPTAYELAAARAADTPFVLLGKRKASGCLSLEEEEEAWRLARRTRRPRACWGGSKDSAFRLTVDKSVVPIARRIARNARI